MSSLIPGYNYDIFISYRQKDNKHDGWVTEFVNNLKGELESTFKEEISVYFDINPHDGLLETHDVDASLKEKLKCLIFIPIISRTYCDQKSFAWEHEFKAFVDLASQDQFGLKVKLPNGNVASRVLPVRIHDLDIADIKLCELILDGVLRGIEFIYEEPGVNRPLTPGDDENKNLKKTRYRNQINKVALTINEIVQGLKTEPEWLKFEKRIGEEEFRQTEELLEKESGIKKKISGRKNPRKLIPGAMVIALLAAALFFTWTRIFNKSSLEKLRSSGERISIAVMPFLNLTNDTTRSIWQNGIQNLLISSLSNTEELKVRQIESITGLLESKGLTSYASLTPSIARTISKKLDANVFIYGSLTKAGATIRINAQLINSKTEEVFKSFQIDGTDENILNIIDSLSIEVKNFLIISKLEKEVTPDFQHLASTNSPEAYKYFISGKNAFLKRDYSTARNILLQAVAIDTNFTLATMQVAFTYGNQGLYKEAKKWSLKLYRKRDQMSMLQKIMANYTYANYFETPHEVINYLEQELEFDDQSPALYWSIGDCYYKLYQYDKAILEFEKALGIWAKWGSKPMWVYGYTSLGYAYHKTGQYKKETELYKKAEQDFPDDPALIYMQTILSLTEADTISANLYIKKLIPTAKNHSASEADINSILGAIYSEVGSLDKADEFFRKALSLEPENPVRLNTLAYFLIDKDKNNISGLELVNKALGISPDNYDYLDTKGWGLYKQGRYKEALEILQKSWDLRMKNAVYDHAAFLHLEAAKKAVLK